MLNAIDDPTSFADSSGTALLAYVTYRMAVYSNDMSLVPYADKAFKLVQASVDADGWLRNTVDPETFDTPSAANSTSPEGQAFVLLLQAAYRDYVASSDSVGTSSPSNSTGNGSSGDDDDGSTPQRCQLVRRG